MVEFRGINHNGPKSVYFVYIIYKENIIKKKTNFQLLFIYNYYGKIGNERFK
jgi:hypothetical protein